LTRQLKLHRKFHTVPEPELIVRDAGGRVRLKREIYEELGVLTKIFESENPPAHLFRLLKAKGRQVSCLIIRHQARIRRQSAQSTHGENRKSET
jgi:hypothetical protein